ncbi:MAG TPA: RNA-directed DNA polymerase [Actinomycetota bacterium]|nr:RNA-directed DNA polymerase [Actinomycetota bacterium]
MERSPGPSRPPSWRLVPKASGGTRRLARLAREDDARFRSLVARVTPFVERELSERVVANRAARGAHPATLAPWRPARRRWRRSIGTVATSGAAIVTDVAECYASIAPEAVGRALARAGVDRATVDALVRWLRELAAVGVEGLPIGPEPSAILANAVLGVGDRSLDGAGVRWFRWVDDWVIVADGMPAAERALSALARGLEIEGLTLREDKTHRFPDARDLVRLGTPARSVALGGRAARIEGDGVA